MIGLIAHIGPVPVEEMLMALPAVGTLLSAVFVTLSAGVRRAGRREED